MNTKFFITGIGICKEAPSALQTIKSVKTVIKAEDLALAATAMALKQAELDSLENSAVIFGIDNAIDGCKEQFFKGLLQDGPIGASPLLFPYTSPNTITAQVTIAFGIKGENITITSGPLSFLKAVDYALELLNSGLIQSAIIGGVSEHEAMVIVAEIINAGKLEKAFSEIISYEDPIKYTPSSDKIVIRSIEDSFRLLDTAIGKKDKVVINAFNEHGYGVGLVIGI
ncbi:MAG: hypothetical protein HY026_03455 [Deltaproteobacteria bacterium]|nr:hypothetical protein [Deltaproteobacteria bacterium]